MHVHVDVYENDKKLHIHLGKKFIMVKSWDLSTRQQHGQNYSDY